MNRLIDYTSNGVSGKVSISGSKSESNRLLILQKIYPNLELHNVSDSDDTKHLIKALASNEKVIDIGHAGTSMRFLIAYFAINEGRKVTLTGSERMKNRPVEILVEALKSLGADIQYLEKIGYPPLLIKGKKLQKNRVKINGNVSSQYISALMLIASSLDSGLEIELIGNVTSVPYLKMTLSLLNEIGIKAQWNENVINIDREKEVEGNIVTVESDWSSASYFYSLVALSYDSTVILSSYNENSLQGDISLVKIYEHFGVETTFRDNSIIISKANSGSRKTLDLNLIDSPDLAQTIVVTCFGLGIACNIVGLHTLKIKETDRLFALHKELSKLGAQIEVTDDSLFLKESKSINSNISIDTYYDHRMAMAFAPLAQKVPLIINDSEVVTKSFTNFWNDFESVLV